MSKVTRFVAILSACALLIAGCGDRTVSTAQNNNSKDKVKVYTTIYPLYDFAKNVGGDRAEVTNILPPGAEPHHWEPTPGDMVNINKSDIFIYCGAGLESWVGSILNNTDNKKMTVVDSSKGVDLLDPDEGDHHDDEGGTSEDRHLHDNKDPHIWLDPANARIMVDNILEGFVKADPDNKDFYTNNAIIYKARLTDLDNKYQTTLAGAKNRHFVVSHDAFGYLARRYGLEQISIRGLSADSEPSPARMAEIISLVQKYGIKYIFTEDLISPKVSEAIAREAGVGTLVLSPLDGLAENEIKEGKDFIALMEKNLESLKLACEAR
ncbi:MAG: metal ABC transporter substrate-binding protein [Bacillota bacterium]